jgi:hypothetical protein
MMELLDAHHPIVIAQFADGHADEAHFLYKASIDLGIVSFMQDTDPLNNQIKKRAGFSDAL